MLRKILASILSAVLLGAVSFAPQLVQAQAAPGPQQSNTLAGLVSTTPDTDDTCNTGAAHWCYEDSTFTVAQTGDVSQLWVYWECTSACNSNDIITLGIFPAAGGSGQTCTFTAPGQVTGWDKSNCRLSSTYHVNQGDSIKIAQMMPNTTAGTTNFTIGGNGNNGSGSNSLVCTGANPAPTLAVLGSTSCSSGTGNSDAEILMFAATGTPSITLTGPAVGNITPSTHTTTVAGHKVQLYRFQNAPGSQFGLPVQFINFFADSTSTSTGWLGAVYTDLSDAPRTPLAQCNAGAGVNSPVSVSPGQWNFCTVNPVEIAPGQNYWLAIWNADATNSLVIDDQSNGSVTTECYTSAALTTPFGNPFVTTGGATCTSKGGMVAAGAFT